MSGFQRARPCHLARGKRRAWLERTCLRILGVQNIFQGHDGVVCKSTQK